MTNKIIWVALGAMLLLSPSLFSQGNKKEAKVLISTSYGDMTVKLYNETPKHRDNFLKLVKEGKYDGTLFHRVINQFMIQGGDPTSKGAQPGKPLGQGGVGYTIPAEFNTKFIHKRGTLSAARMGDGVNPKKESSGCQFYLVQGKKYSRKEVDNILKGKNSKRKPEEIVSYTEEQYKVYESVGGTPHLDMDYTVFGEIVDGLEVVDKIAIVEKDRRDRPTKDIPMSVKIVKE